MSWTRRRDEVGDVLIKAERNPAAKDRSRIAGARARVHAAHGDRAAASEVEDLLAMVADTSFVNIKSDALIDAAEAMASLGDRAAATGYAREALRLAEAKENLALAGQIRLLLGRLED